MIEVKSLETTNELENAIEDNEVQLDEFQIQKDIITYSPNLHHFFTRLEIMLYN